MITQQRLRELFWYFPMTGNFVCKVNRGRAKAGSIVGSHNKRGYQTIGIDGKVYYTHRLAFLYMLGYVPDMVDHIDNDPSNNVWSNLQVSNYHDNNRKKNMLKNNTSGTQGVHFRNCDNKWCAFIHDSTGKYICKLCSSYEDAVQMRRQLEKEYDYKRGV